MDSLFEPIGDDAKSAEKPMACSMCSSLELSSRTQLKVCEPCRQRLIKRPFPWWVKIATLAILVLVIGALAATPHHWQRALVFARVEKMTQQSRWEEAYQAFLSIDVKYRNDTDMQLQFAEIAVASRHYPEASQALHRLSGRHCTSQQLRRANSIDRDLEKIEMTQATLKDFLPRRPPIR